MRELLEVRGLKAEVGGKPVLRGVNLRVGVGELHVLMGPNGAGKSSLLKTIMGIPEFRVVGGQLLFMGRRIEGLKPHERARLGIAMAFQNPPRIDVRLSYIIKRLSEKYGSSVNGYHEFLDEKIRSLMERKLFHGFSGGEAKRVELLLTLLQRPKLALLDEPDSGVDVDSLVVVGRVISKLREQGASVLLVTHTGYVLRHVGRVDAVHVMVGGRIVYSGSSDVVTDLLEKGYDAFLAEVSSRGHGGA